MRWSDLFTFMCTRDRKFAGSLASVPRDLVSECERGCGITLPAFYGEFLMAMGADSGRYHPFGAAHDHDFYALVERIPGATYPVDRYFRVALQVDPDLDALEEPYLDLARAADGDTPLVTIEEGGGFDPSQFLDMGVTLAEALVGNAFYTFELAPRGHRATVSAGADSADEAATLRDAAVDLLDGMGLLPLLVPSPRLMCLGAAGLAARVELHGPGYTTLAIDLAAADRLVIRNAAEQLAAALPGGSVLRPGMRVSND